MDGPLLVVAALTLWLPASRDRRVVAVLNVLALASGAVATTLVPAAHRPPFSLVEDVRHTIDANVLSVHGTVIYLWLTVATCVGVVAVLAVPTLRRT
jgi:hypothetical protein